MARKLPGRAIQAGSISTTQLDNTVTTVISQGGGPKITNIQVTNNTYTVIDDTAVDTAGGYIRITGTGFTAGCQVLINNVPATSTTFVSATEVRAQVPATAAGTYVIYLVNTDGGVAIRVNGITFSATPTWVTGSTLSDGAVDSAISIQLSATLATTYSLQAGSTLPTGLTLSSSGLISGTVTGLVNDTSYSFTVIATDAENQDSPRTFTITITTTLQVSRSLRFNSADNTNLTRTPAVAGNRRIWTLSLWFKRTSPGSIDVLFDSFVNGQTVFRTIFDDSTNKLQFQNFVSDSAQVNLITTQVFRDPAAWYHIVWAVDTTQATASNRVKLYINGVQVTAFDTTTYPSQNYDMWVNAATIHYIGSEGTWGVCDGYMSEYYLIDGQQLLPTSFAKTDPTTGQWVPGRYTGTYGTNGFYLNFSDNSATTATTLGKDSSGNNNNWTPNNFSVAAGAGNDSLVDSPTNYGTDTGLGGEVRGNYCVLNQLKKGYSSDVYNNGALETVGGYAYPNYFGTISVTSGKWYYEVVLTQTSSSVVWVGWTNVNYNRGIYVSIRGIYGDVNQYLSDGSQINYTGTTRVVNDIVGCAADLDNNTVNFYRNGVAQGSISYTFTGSAWLPAGTGGGGFGAGDRATLNFGQRPFAYAAPAGYKVLCSTNLPAPVVKSNTAFDATLWVGDATASRNITGFNFAPDLVWIKNRTNSYSHYLSDTVRGVNKQIYTDATEAESSLTTVLSAFNSDGFTIGNNVGVNNSGSNIVAWAWDAGTTTVVNTAGTISSNVRVNTTAGFSIVRFIGSATNNSVGHGLGVPPSFVIFKAITAGSEPWRVYHASLASNGFLTLSLSAGVDTSIANYWGSGMTSSVLGVYAGGTGGNNVAGATMIAYCWAAVPGFSAFGTWTGNGSADGPFVYTGFRPKFILAKQTNTGGQNWYMLDSLRPGRNVTNARLYPNLTNPEDADGNINADFLSNGFKIRDAYTGWNASGGTYAYAAFAEQPFKYSRAS